MSSAQPDVHATAAALRVSVGQFRRRARERSTAGDVSAPELTALSRIDRGGPLSIADLARLEQITPQAMGSTVGSLEQRGLVTRSADPDDGRRSLFTLTDDGRTTLSTGRSALVDHIATVLTQTCTPREIATLHKAAALLQRVAEQL